MRPEFLLVLLFGGLYGVLFHLWRGRSLGDLITFTIVGVVGFGLGVLAGSKIGLRFLTVGQVHMVEGTLLSWGSLFVARWLKT